LRVEGGEGRRARDDGRSKGSGDYD
jgi:hypothetical protein